MKKLLLRLPCPALCAALPAALILFQHAPIQAGIKNILKLGYDTYIDRFTILEEDTLEAVHEFKMGLMNNLSLHRGDLKTELRNSFSYGNQTMDENLHGELSYGHWKSTRIDLRSNLHWKHFQKGSDYSFGNDYIQSNTYLRLKKGLGEKYRISVKNRFEVVNYRDRTDFDYDYTYFDAGLEFEGGSYFSRFGRLGASVGFKEAPDTTALSYRRTIADIEMQLASGDNSNLHITASGDRRDYRENVRSSYWNVISYLDFALNTLAGKSYSLKLESELMMFDEPSSTFFNTYFIRAGFKAKMPLSASAAAFAEPRYARMLCGDFAEERYWEGSIVFGVDVLGSTEFWLSFSYEPGYRNYTETENELYSDFYLNRLSLMGSMSLPGKITLNLFVTHDPERHSRREDDFSITLMSIELTRQF